MQRSRFVFLTMLFAALVCGHPMGNFSVNHYARILPQQDGAEIEYVLDFGEIPTYDLLKNWNSDGQVRDWVRNLTVKFHGTKVEPRLQSTHVTQSDGAGGMKTMRVEMKLSVKGSGKLEYADANYPDRAGWKEIVIGSGPDKSRALTAYPTDPAAARPQDLRVAVDFTNGKPVVTTEAAPAAQQIEAAPEPSAKPPAKRRSNDYISNVLHGGEITVGVGLVCLLVAFGLGALHAFEPGHGKTMVAAYLVGSRGTPKHAVLLGLMTTFTHTVSVFLLGFVTLFLSRYIMPEKMTRVLGVVSGLSIVWIGALMLYRRALKLMEGAGHHHHHHHHDHEHPHHHHHDHDHDHHHHDHDHEHAHHHMPEGEITMGSLMALGASGGLVPCPAALILLLTCISLGRPAFGILLLLSFSIGLAIVLMATGLVVLYAKNLLPERHRNPDSAFLRTMPVVSAAIILMVGIVTTGVSLGWFPAVRFLG